MNIPDSGTVFVSLRDHDKNENSGKIIRLYSDMGFKICASEGTGRFLRENGIPAEIMAYSEVEPLIGSEMKILINTPKAINQIGADTFPLRRAAIERGLPVLTCMDTARAFAAAVELRQKNVKLSFESLQ